MDCRRRWAQRTEVPVGDLGGTALGVVGYGRIGQRTAQLGAAFGMRILAYDPVSEPPADVRCAGLGWLPSTPVRSGSRLSRHHLPICCPSDHAHSKLAEMLRDQAIWAERR